MIPMKSVLEAMKELRLYCKIHGKCQDCKLWVDNQCFLKSHKPEEYDKIIQADHITLTELKKECVTHYEYQKENNEERVKCFDCPIGELCPMRELDYQFKPLNWRL